MPSKRDLFSLGNIVGAPGAIEAMPKAGASPVELLSRHVSGDWGDLVAEDKLLNDTAVAGREGRIMSAYILPDGVKVWIITESDRSVTTILLPEEY